MKKIIVTLLAGLFVVSAAFAEGEATDQTGASASAGAAPASANHDAKAKKHAGAKTAKVRKAKKHKTN